MGYYGLPNWLPGLRLEKQERGVVSNSLTRTSDRKSDLTPLEAGEVIG